MTGSIVISSGHGKYIRGASGYLDEVNEARRVVEETARLMRDAGVKVSTYHDDQSHSQNENLNRIVNYHNGQSRDLDVSVHFNAYQTTSAAMGTECLYLTQEALAGKVADAIANATELPNRGPKYRDNLFFLNSTSKPSVLVETVFVDSKKDADVYNQKFAAVCAALASALSGKRIGAVPPEQPAPPEGVQPPVEIPEEEPGRRTIGIGDAGGDVAYVQTLLGIPDADGDFGPITDSAVRGYQAAYGEGVTCDGIVGPKTWHALDYLESAKTSGNDRLPADQARRIADLAEKSAIAKYAWKDRGVLPKGYTAGIAQCFGLAATRLMQGHPIATTAAQADRNLPDYDALSWYRSRFEALGMDNSQDGIDTLRHLFVLLLGLGARESSGRYCEGRDMSADNVTADTAEASMYQTSWNIRSCSPAIAPMLQEYWANPNGFLPTFQQGCNPKSDDLGNFGSGDGAKFQFLSKYSPAFHVFVTGVGLRYQRQHWGPINRSEVELRIEADEMLMQVQHLLSENSAENEAAMA
jgi:peptidoglycan hydrolase-like protein with peptidoglycan-binding domain